MADAHGSGPCGRKSLRVQLPFRPFLFFGLQDMRKYTTYRRSAPTSRRRSTVRGRNTFSFFKSLFTFALLLVLGAGLYLGLHKGYDAFMQSSHGKWQVKNITVEGVTGLLQKEITQQLLPYQNKTFSLKDSYTLRSALVAKYPMLKDLSVKRGLLSGTLSVSAKMREPVAQFKLADGTVKYLDKDSTVYADANPTLSQDVPTVELVGAVPERVEGGFTDLVQSALQLDKRLNFQTLRLDLNENTVTMILPDQTVLNLGRARQLKEKAQRASQILSFAREHYAQPYALDFRFFDEGKVFLTRRAN